MALLTKYVDKDTVATGGNGDVGDKWKYLWEATAAIKTDAGTNHYKVYVKASQTYGTDGTSPNPAESDDAGHDGAGGDAGAVIYIDQVSPGATTPNVFEGYDTSPGDGGIVTLDCAYDGANKLTNGIWCGVSSSYQTVFKNFSIENADGDGIEGPSGDYLAFKNVRVKLSGGKGLDLDNYVQLENCMFDNNGGAGSQSDATLIAISCIFRNNGNEGVIGDTATYYNCLAYNNGDTDVMKANGHAAFLGCTIDGDEDGGKTSSRCIRQDATTSNTTVANCIIYDAGIGILADGIRGDMNISRNCLFNANTDDASAYPTEYDGSDGAPSTGNGVGNLGHVTGVPGFTGTYLPGANAQSAALDHQYTNNFWASFDGATNPPEPENE